MSERKTNELLEDAKMKMNGYAMLFNFHLMNLCIKAEPMALLSATVDIDGQGLNLEDVATVALASDTQFAVTPKSSEYIFPVCKAIKLEHPEFEMEEKIERNEITDEEDTVIYYTMPVVNEDRRDVCMEYIKTRYDININKIKIVLSTTTAKIVSALVGASVETIDSAKVNLQELHDWHINLCDQLREEKEKEVEDAYQEYLKDMAEKTKKTEEKAAAQGQDTVFSLNMNDE